MQASVFPGPRDSSLKKYCHYCFNLRRCRRSGYGPLFLCMLPARMRRTVANAYKRSIKCEMWC